MSPIEDDNDNRRKKDIGEERMKECIEESVIDKQKKMRQKKKILLPLKFSYLRAHRPLQFKVSNACTEIEKEKKDLQRSYYRGNRNNNDILIVNRCLRPDRRAHKKQGEVIDLERTIRARIDGVWYQDRLEEDIKERIKEKKIIGNNDCIQQEANFKEEGLGFREVVEESNLDRNRGEILKKEEGILDIIVVTPEKQTDTLTQTFTKMLISPNTKSETYGSHSVVKEEVVEEEEEEQQEEVREGEEVKMKRKKNFRIPTFSPLASTSTSSYFSSNYSISELSASNTRKLRTVLTRIKQEDTATSEKEKYQTLREKENKRASLLNKERCSVTTATTSSLPSFRDFSSQVDSQASDKSDESFVLMKIRLERTR